MRLKAEHFGVTEALANAMLADGLGHAADDFTSTVERVVQKHETLYRRLTPRGLETASPILDRISY